MVRADHCWDDVIDPAEKQIYAEFFNRTERVIGPKPALLAIDLYEKVYAGGAKPVAEVNKDFPGSCGINAWTAIEPTKKLFAAARAATPAWRNVLADEASARPRTLPSTSMVTAGDTDCSPRSCQHFVRTACAPASLGRQSRS